MKRIKLLPGIFIVLSVMRVLAADQPLVVISGPAKSPAMSASRR